MTRTPKPQPWYTALNPTPRSPKHGRNWRTSSPAHGSPVDRADSGVDPGSQDTTAIWSTRLPPATWRTIWPPSAGASDPVAPTPIDTISDDMAQALEQVYIHLSKGFYPSAIPYAGVRAGELTGYRMWYVLEAGLKLCSLAHYFIWEPGAVIEGDVDKVVSSSIFSPNLYGGVYCYVDSESVLKELAYCDPTFPRDIYDSDPYRCYRASGIAYGRIKLWGEVIEHQRGYRAQYAKLTHLDGVFGLADLNELRSKYLG